MPLKVEKQVGRVLARMGVADDHADEWSQDHDEGKDLDPDVPAGHR